MTEISTRSPEAAGVRSLAELPRTLYSVYTDFIAMWDDYDVMTGIKKRIETKGGREYVKP